MVNQLGEKLTQFFSGKGYQLNVFLACKRSKARSQVSRALGFHSATSDVDTLHLVGYTFLATEGLGHCRHFGVVPKMVFLTTEIDVK